MRLRKESISFGRGFDPRHATMVQQLLNEPDLDAILQWSVMQKFMDELSETEEEASGSSDDMALRESLVALPSERPGGAHAPAPASADLADG